MSSSGIGLMLRKISARSSNQAALFRRFSLPRTLKSTHTISLNFSRRISASSDGTVTTATQMAENLSLLDKVKALVPSLQPDKYKGQAGKVGVIGGCREYTGAPFFASFSALKVGADLSHVFCTPGAATVIKCYSPELIVHPYLPEPDETNSAVASTQQREASFRAEAAAAAVCEWIDRFDVLVVGPGLGRDPLILGTVAIVLEEARRRGIPLVIDADGLWLLNQRPELLQGYASAVLTPNGIEFRRLAERLGEAEDASDALQQVTRRLEGPVVVRKGAVDAISNGTTTVECSEEGSLRRAGGQGDVLSGTIAAYVAWARRQEGGAAVEGDALVLAAYGGCLTTRMASKRAFEKHGRAMGATDVMNELGGTVDALAGSK